MICPPEHTHGMKHTCYNTHGCRCEDCRTARASKRRLYDWNTRRLQGYDVKVPATGSVRRLRALAVMGWSIPELADRTGLFHRNLLRIREGQRVNVYLSTHTAIVGVFEQLCMTRNVTHSGRITRTLALRHGWLPPLVWNDIDRDRGPRGARRAA